MTRIALALALALASNVAFGVTTKPEQKPDAAEEIGFVSPGDAERALTDVQIRRIKNLMVSRVLDAEQAFEQLEKLQGSLGGQR